MDENTKKYNILIVDDERNNLDLLKRTFRNRYNIFEATSGHQALEILKDHSINLIISDHKMPEMSGVEFLTQAFILNPDPVRILVTAYTDISMLMEAINTAKIYRYIKKPWNPTELLNMVEKALELYQLSLDNQDLIFDLKDLFSGTIAAITGALDAKDSFTFGRSKRVALYTLEVGKYIGLSDSQLSELELAGLLHDIGMIGVPESILHKPEALTQEEYDIIKKHVMFGVKILEDIKQLEPVLKIMKLHHERFDGKGYPYGLKGEEIPVGARIIAVADAYDGITSDRPYRKGLPHEVATEELKKSAGAQFDPAIVDAFINIVDKARILVKNI